MVNFLQKFKDLFKEEETEEDHLKKLEQQNEKAERLAALHTKARKQLKKNKKSISYTL